MTAPVPAASTLAHRTEHDLLGDREVPARAYYGVHTLRAVENFPITGTPISVHPELVVALACVKQAAAQANKELGLLDARRADAIVRACEEIRAGHLHDEFVVDVIQGGAGTSTNMNANEVVANRALELLGHPRGHYTELHPLEHVNLSQSTNDAYPTAVRIALQAGARQLGTALSALADAFSAKAAEFAPVVKMGRTQLQDAVPMTLGQEFGAFAVTIREDVQRLAEAARLLLEINLGGTAIGTGLNAPDQYAALACARLRALTDLPLATAADLVEATWDVGAFVQLSGVLKRIAVKLSKICNDLRLLSSGPRTGLGEINLPPVQAGSSIMPGKVNPVIPEAVNQVAFRVIGHDVAVTLAAEAGQLQLNAFEPVIAHSLLDSLAQLGSACRTLTERCVTGITANAGRLRHDVDHSIGTVTALNPFIGYTAATSIATDALATGRSVRELVLERGLLTAAQLDRLLSPENLAFTTRPLSET
ncbi:aspartate ammonia-lyase [Streptacidiphilus anmyonensis]|uniref:aspartate ammonia-lyase n=1 Tax=Streptacidiphilus anmyonensis TaxID=405782 RepID=UPI0005A9E3E4|nr:aspartate ammonia-lyase [Streptacidiphilus anmyonensis]